MVLLAAAMIGSCYLYDSTMRMLLYSVLPESQQNWISFGVLWAEEVRTVLFAGGVAILVWQLQVISFDLVNKSLTAVADSAEAKQVSIAQEPLCICY